MRRADPAAAPLRIGLLTSSFPRHRTDPAGHFVLGFARALARRGHEVDVLAPEPPDGPPPPGWLPPGVHLHPVAYLRPAGLQRTFYGAGAPENLSRDPAAWPGALAFPVALARAAARIDRGWDALVSHWALPAGLSATWVQRGRPHLAVLHSGDVHALERLPGGALAARRLADRATALLFTHEALRDRFHRLLGPRRAARAAARSHVSPMGIDPPPPVAGGRRGARRRLGLPPPGRLRVALVLGRLVPIKGVDVALEAVARLHGEILLAVAGAGPERARLETLAARLGAPARFLGAIGGATKADWLAAADVLLVPSRPTRSGRTEGVPHAALEALAAGLPVLASRTGGLSTLASCPAVRLVDPGDPVALADALRAWPPAGSRASLSRAARRHVAPLHWEALAPRIEALLR